MKTQRSTPNSQRLPGDGDVNSIAIIRPTKYTEKQVPRAATQGATIATMRRISLVIVSIFAAIEIVLGLCGCKKEELPMTSPPGTNAPPAEEIPRFPWPPPEASATMSLPPEFFSKAKVLGDVERKLSSALGSCDYAETSYYAVPDGFALVTRLEQINPDGMPKAPPDRWSVKTTPLRDFSLGEYIRALFGERPGKFRIIVFVVTPHPFSQANVTVSREEAIAWLPRGLNKLPMSIAEQPYSTSHTCTALIYEFALPETQAKATLSKPSGLSCKTHLSKAMVWSFLER